MGDEIEVLSKAVLKANFEGESKDQLLEHLCSTCSSFESQEHEYLIRSLDILLRPFVHSVHHDSTNLANFIHELYEKVDQNDTSSTAGLERLQSILIDLVYVIGYGIESSMLDAKNVQNELGLANTSPSTTVNASSSTPMSAAPSTGTDNTSPNEDKDSSEMQQDAPSQEPQPDPSVQNLNAFIESYEAKKQAFSKLVNSLVDAKLLQDNALKAKLDMSLLRAINIPPSQNAQTTLLRQETRGRTMLLYKQQKYNLAREESEGYSKLLVVLLTKIGLPHDTGTGYPTESPERRKQRVDDVLINIKSLIGYFDLDPTRVLDIILDVFSEQIVNYSAFFRDLLASSPWGPQSFNNNNNNDNNENSMDIDNDSNDNTLPDGTLPKPTGSSIIGQVLGFKFKCQQNVHQREVEKIWTRQEGEYKPGTLKDVTPSRLYLLAAVLIWDGTVNLVDLYPHLSPSDDEMKAMKDKHLDDMDEKAAAGSENKLAMMGALIDDEAPEESNDAEKTKKAAAPIELPNQKIAMLRALLHVGALNEAMFILGRYPFLSGPSPQVAESLLRLMDVMIDPAFRPLSISFNNPQTITSIRTPKLRYNTQQKKLADPPKPRTLLTSSTQIHIRQAYDYIYFWPYWRSRLPSYSTPDQVLQNIINILLPLVGVHSSRNKSFFYKLSKIIANEVSSKEPEKLEKWRNAIRVYILPAICMTDKDPSVAVLIWDILKSYDEVERFAFYGELTDKYKRNPELKVRKSEITRESRDYMRRLSTETLKTVGKSLAKLAHSNPLVVYEIMLNQVMSYDNFIGPASETARFLGKFELDVLQYVIITAFANPKRDITKSDGTNLSLWLQSLASYTGSLFKRSSMTPTLVTEFVVHQLEVYNVDYIIILREVLDKMTGISPISDLNAQQIRALGGGRELRADILSPTEIRPNIKLSTQLRSSLVGDLATRLLVQLAFARQVVLYNTDENQFNLKFLANLYDQTHAVLYQYIDFLYQLDSEDYATIVPEFEDLVSKYDIDPSIAFTLLRPVIWSKVKPHDESKFKKEEEKAAKIDAQRLAALREKVKQQRASASPSASKLGISSSEPSKETEETKAEEGEIDDNLAEGEAQNGNSSEDTEKLGGTEPGEEVADSSMKEDQREETEEEEAEIDNEREDEKEKEEEKESDKEEPPVKEDVEMTDANDQLAEKVKAEQEGTPASAGEEDSSSPWNPALVPLMEKVSEIYPEEIWNLISPGLFTTFWQLGLYDVYDLGETYEKQCSRLRNVVLTAQHQVEEASQQVNTIDAAVRRKRKQDYDLFSKKCPLTSNKLKQEKEVQAKDSKAVWSRLRREKDYWFPNKQQGNTKIREATSHALMETCIFARSRLSPTDAVYCANFLNILHGLGTPGFSTLSFYDKCVFPDHQALTPMIFQMTENEAANHGTFLYEILSHLTRWIKDPALYRKEAIGEETKLPGWILKTAGAKGDQVQDEDYLDHDKFLSVMTKWHGRLVASFKLCLESKEFMQVRNCLSIMYKIAKFFPRNFAHGEELDASVRTLLSDERGDIKMLAQGFVAILAKQRKQGVWAGAPATATAGSKLGSSSAVQTPAGGASPRPTKSANPTPPPSVPQTPQHNQQQQQQQSSTQRPSSLQQRLSQSPQLSTSSSLPPLPAGLPQKPSTTYNRHDNANNANNRGQGSDSAAATSNAKLSNKKEDGTSTPTKLASSSKQQESSSSNTNAGDTNKTNTKDDDKKQLKGSSTASKDQEQVSSVSVTSSGANEGSVTSRLDRDQERNGGRERSDRERGEYRDRDDDRSARRQNNREREQRERRREQRERDDHDDGGKRRSRHPSVESTTSKDKDRERTERDTEQRDRRSSRRDRDRDREHRDRRRDRDRDREKDKDKDKEKDKEKDKDKEREREKDKDKDKDKESKGKYERRQQQQQNKDQDSVGGRRTRTSGEDDSRQPNKRQRREDEEGPSPPPSPQAGKPSSAAKAYLKNIRSQTSTSSTSGGGAEANSLSPSSAAPKTGDNTDTATSKGGTSTPTQEQQASSSSRGNEPMEVDQNEPRSAAEKSSQQAIPSGPRQMSIRGAAQPDISKSMLHRAVQDSNRASSSRHHHQQQQQQQQPQQGQYQRDSRGDHYRDQRNRQGYRDRDHQRNSQDNSGGGERALSGGNTFGDLRNRLGPSNRNSSSSSSSQQDDYRGSYERRDRNRRDNDNNNNNNNNNNKDRENRKR